MDERCCRTIALLDMDCFYVQVEQRDQPETWGQPAAVVQYNPWRGGGIIAVNYEAREKGVTRAMRGDDAKQKCPDIILFQVAESRGKADLTKYRKASAEVIDVICNYSELITVERASIDEAYLDLTKLVATIEKMPDVEAVKTTFLAAGTSCDFDNVDITTATASTTCCFTHFHQSSPQDLPNRRLIIACDIVSRIRQEIFDKTGLKCSAGISHNKILAKLCCSLHKPNAQTVLPYSNVHALFMKTPLHKVRNFGGKLGEEIKDAFKITYFGELASIEYSLLCAKFDEKTAKWLVDLVQGIDLEPVVARQITKSIGCAKNFPVAHKTALLTKSDVIFWLGQLVSELVDRLIEDREMNKRIAKLASLGIRLAGNETMVRSLPLHRYDSETILQDAMRHILPKVLSFTDESSEKLKYPVIMLSISASKFDNFNPKNLNSTLDDFFGAVVNKPVSESPNVIENSVKRGEKRVLNTSESFSDESNEKQGFFHRKSYEFAMKGISELI